MFVQFLHDQLLTLASSTADGSRRQVAAIRRALCWAAFLSRDPLFIPTVDLVQSPAIEGIVTDLGLLAKENFVQFVGSSVDIDDLHRSKRAHFNRTAFLAPWKDSEALARLPQFESALQARQFNTTADLKLRWMADVGSFASRRPGDSETPLTLQMREVAVMLDRKPTDRRLIHSMTMLPSRLEDHAFLWKVIEDLRIFPFRTTGAPRHALEVGLAWHWLVSHLQEYGTRMLVGLPGLGLMDFGVSRSDPASVIDLRTHLEAVRVLGLDRAFAALDLAAVLALRVDPSVLALRDGLLTSIYELLRHGATEAESERLYARSQQVRDGVGGLLSPEQALRTAGEISISSDGTRSVPTAFPAKRASIGVAIALPEELEVIQNLLPSMLGELMPEDSKVSGHTIYRAPDFTTDGGVDISLFFAVVGKGQERAGVGVAEMITEHHPEILVNLGIAGSLSEDLYLGDVVVGTDVMSYLSDSKAVPEGKDGFIFRLGGQAVPTDAYLRERASQMDLRLRQEMIEYRERLFGLARQFLPDGKLLTDLEFRVLSGPIASGPTVGAANAFKKWLREHRRNYLAIEMEASGIGIAVEQGSMLSRLRYLVLRGISDLADENKARLEAETEAGARQLAVAAPLALLLALLKTLPAEAFAKQP